MTISLTSRYEIEIDTIATGRNLKSLFDKDGLSRSDLSKLLGVTQRQISNLFEGKYNLKHSYLIKLADILDTSINDILVLKRVKDFDESFIAQDTDNNEDIKSDNRSNIFHDRIWKLINKTGISLRVVDNKNHIMEVGKDGYSWREIQDSVYLPNIDKQTIYDFIRARNEYERLSGVEFNRNKKFQIDLEV